jgi:hypothetical protein
VSTINPTNPRYLIKLTAKPRVGDTVRIETPMPENFSVNLTIEWASQYASIIQEQMNKLGGTAGQVAGLVSKLAPIFGQSTQAKVMTAQIWQGTSGLELTVPFIFKAQSDSDIEVVNPIKQLMKIALPSVSAIGTLESPFSPLKQATSTADNGVSVDIKFGDFFRLPSCVITSISQSYDSIFDRKGNPISAKVDLQVRSFYIITVEDIDTLIKGGIKVSS